MKRINKKALVAFVVVIIGIAGILALSNSVNTPSSKLPSNEATANYTFAVYRWQGGNVTRDMLDEYASVRGAIRMDLLFTYRINSTGGIVVYNGNVGAGFNIVSSQFETDLTKNTHGWTKTNETVNLPIGIYCSDQGTNYAYLFS